MFKRIKDILIENYLAINLTVFTMFIIYTFILIRIWQLYEPQAIIVIHDYGQVFESETDWKIWRLEHEGK